MKTRYQNGDEVEMVIKTQKESQTGLFNNERLLMIKAGIVSYFSNIPKKFTGSARAIEMSGQVPKFTIAANQISKIQLTENELSILVLKSKLISRDEFGQMVKGTKNIPQIKGSTKGDGGGYQQWIFKSQDEQSLIQFYHLINLFRTNNPNFQPHLAQMVQGFQNKKNSRKKTIDPSRMIQMSKQIQPAYRRSEIPQSKNQQFWPQIKEKVTIPPPIASSFSQEDFMKQDVRNPKQKTFDQIKVEQDIESFEEERLNLVKDKININNQPRMSIIEQKPGEDKNSQMSKTPYVNQPFIEIIKTFQEQIPQALANEEAIIQRANLQPQIMQQIKVQTVIISQQEKVEQKKVYREQQVPKKKRQKQSLQISNFSNLDAQSMVQFEVKQQRKQKVNQLIKSACLLHKNDHESMAKSIGISTQQLVQFLKVNHPDQQDTWEFIQNQLTKIISNQKDKSNHPNIFNLQTQVISNYHILNDCYNTDLKSYQLLEGEISFDSYQQESQSQNIIMQWLKFQVSGELSKSFSTRIFNKFENRISLRKILFNQKQIIDANGSWVVNRGGHLQQFLAYLCLQKIMKELKQKQKGKFEFKCVEHSYIKYKQYQALIKPLNISKSLYPLKSIKALQFFSKSKAIKFFQRSFPQFSINVQILKTEAIYRFNLERISESFQLPGIQNQLKKINFVIEPQFQQYYNTVQYEQIRKRCLNQLSELQSQNKKINQNTLQEIVLKCNSNIQIDIIFKWLGARLNKNNLITFQPSILRLGNCQFSSQLSLIKKTRKKGNLQLSYMLVKKLMNKLQFYRLVTPSSHFVAVYLQFIDMMILQKGQLHRTVPALLKLSHYLSQFEVENYSVYLALMKSYIKLHQVQNFIKTLQNCRLFLNKLLKESAFIFDFQLCRILLALNSFQNPQKGQENAQILINKTKNCQNLPEELKQKYISKLIWDKKYYKAFSTIFFHLQQLQKTQNCLQTYWIQGVLYLAKSWIQMQEVNVMNAASLQKKIERAISFCLSRQLFDIAFLLKDYGEKIIIRCRQFNLPRFLQNQPSFEQTKIWFNSIREQMLQLIIDLE